MAASIEDFVRRLTRLNRKFTFIFTEEFFRTEEKNNNFAERYLNLRNMIRNIGHRKGTKSTMHVDDETVLFDVEIVIIHRAGCFTTTFKQLSNEVYSDEAVICGYGNGMVDAQKAKFLVDTFFAQKKEHESQTVNAMLVKQKGRQAVLVVESPADLKRPCIEPIRNLRHRLATILVNPTKGPLVDCQVMTVYQESNTNTLSSLFSHFCKEL